MPRPTESTAEAAYYYVLDFCKVFSVSKTQFYREVREGRLHIFHRARRTMVERGEAERWMATYMAPSSALGCPAPSISAETPALSHSSQGGQ